MQALRTEVYLVDEPHGTDVAFLQQRLVEDDVLVQAVGTLAVEQLEDGDGIAHGRQAVQLRRQVIDAARDEVAVETDKEQVAGEDAVVIRLQVYGLDVGDDALHRVECLGVVDVVGVAVHQFVVFVQLAFQVARQEERLVAAFVRGDRIDGIQDGLRLVGGRGEDEDGVKHLAQEVVAVFQVERTVEYQDAPLPFVVLNGYHKLSPF